jgi:hypothetical protein
MTMDAQAQQRNVEAPSTEPAIGETSKDSQDIEDGATRSQQNILTWLSYLPRTCVKAMIRMGWDKST